VDSAIDPKQVPDELTDRKRNELPGKIIPEDFTRRKPRQNVPSKPLISAKWIGLDDSIRFVKILGGNKRAGKQSGARVL
jgi:hypothetical protein